MEFAKPPEVPFGVKVLDKSGRSVQLSWSAPYDGNSPLTRYLIEYKVSKGDWQTDIDRVLVPGQQTIAGVYNLMPATNYHFRLVAENDVGASEPSETVTIITAEEAPSGAPRNVKVEFVDQHTLKVSWKPPPREHWNGEIRTCSKRWNLVANRAKNTSCRSPTSSNVLEHWLRSIILIKFSLLMHQSIALEELYVSCFECTTIRPSAQPQIDD